MIPSTIKVKKNDLLVLLVCQVTYQDEESKIVILFQSKEKILKLRQKERKRHRERQREGDRQTEGERERRQTEIHRQRDTEREEGQG